MLPTTGLKVGAERNTRNDTWTVSFRTKNDVPYNISTATGSTYVKLANFTGGSDYPLNSSVVSGLSEIRWGFYSSDGTGNAYYYKPTSTNNYTTDDTSGSSSSLTIVTPSTSVTYSSQTLHTSLYNPDTAASADGERITTITDLGIDGYDYGSVISLYSIDSTNSLYLGNSIRYNGWLGTGSNVNVIPYTEKWCYYQLCKVYYHNKSIF